MEIMRKEQVMPTFVLFTKLKKSPDIHGRVIKEERQEKTILA